MPANSRFGSRGLGPYVTVEERVDGELRPVPVARLAVTNEEVALLYEAYQQYRVVDPEDPDDPEYNAHKPVKTSIQQATHTLLRTTDGPSGHGSPSPPTSQ